VDRAGLVAFALVDGDYPVILSMKGKEPGSLPKGLPTPPADSAITWAVFIANKQWAKVATSIETQQEDKLIVEGYPLLKDGIAVVLAQSCKSVFLEKASKDPLIRIDNELRRLRTQLGAQNLGSDKIPPKPRRMHWHTYMRVATRIADLQYWRLLAFSIDIAKLGESMGIPSPASIDDATEDLRRRMGKKASGSW